MKKYFKRFIVTFLLVGIILVLLYFVLLKTSCEYRVDKDFEKRECPFYLKVCEGMFCREFNPVLPEEGEAHLCGEKIKCLFN